MTATNTDPIPPDTRSIDEMNFGSGAADQQSVAKAVRETLRKCGVNVAHEIEELGCTGASAKGLSTTQIAELRLGLGGGGVGLPCFVPPTRYCLAHSTIGGLQIGQMSRYPTEISKISRELSPRERGSIELIEASRRVRGGNLDERLMKTADALSGRDLPAGVEMGDSGEIVEASDLEDVTSVHYREVIERDRTLRSQPPRASAPRKSSLTQDGDLIEGHWTCPEHRVPAWSCRYCVAQMIVEGPLEPMLAVRPEVGGFTKAGVPAHEASAEIEYLGHAGANRVDLYVRAATYTRKLARD